MMARLTFQVEVTTRCNGDCTFCPRDVIPSNRALGDLTPEMADLLVQRLAELGPRSSPLVSFSGFGEPTVYPGLVELMCRVKSTCRTSIRLNTNAILLDEIGDLIISSECVDQLVLSLNLPTEELYRKYKRVDNFLPVRDSIIRFLREKGARKPATDLRLIRIPEAVPFLDEAREFWRGHFNKNDRISLPQLANWGGLIGVPGRSRRRRCRYLQTAGRHLSIDKDGYASICCFSVAFNHEHPLMVGNIEDHSLRELLSRARQRASSFDLSLCKDCNAR